MGTDPCSLHLQTIFLWFDEKKTPNNKYVLELIKRGSKFKKKLSCECALNFDQGKTFSEHYKPMRVWLWLV